MRQTLKLCIFLAALVAYYFCGGFASPMERGMLRFFATVDVVFLFGLIGALWAGNVRIGVLQPVSLRGIFIALGCLVVIGAFVVTIATREDRKSPPYSPFPNKGTQACPLFEIHV